MIVEKLPIPFSGFTTAEIRNLKPSVLANVRKELSGNVSRYFNAMTEFVSGVLYKLNDVEQSYNDIKKMPLRDAELIVLRGMSLSSITDKLSTKSLCKSCGSINSYGQTSKEDNRIDISELEINYCDKEDPTFTIFPLSEKEARSEYKQIKGESDDSYNNRIHTLTNGLKTITRKIKGSDLTENFTIKSITFRQPTLQDCISVSTKLNTGDYEFDIALYKSLMVGMEFEYDGSDDINGWKDAYNKYEFDGFWEFNSPVLLERIKRKTFDYGIEPFFKVDCNCGISYKQAYAFHSFFVFALLLDGNGREN